MACDGCVEAVRNVLARVRGVSSTRVEIGRAEVEGGDPALLMEAVRDAGFGAEVARVS
jgi:copper chaperone CopZ